MKKKLLIPMLIIAFASCRKESDIVQKSDHSLSSLESSISVYEGIPRYSSVEVFKSAYESLLSQYETTNESIALEHDGCSTDDEGCTHSWDLWDESVEPFLSFESSIGFSSLWHEEFEAEKTWLLS